MTAAPKLKWINAEAPTGRYRSFSFRGWPSAYIGKNDGPIAFNLVCVDDYIPAKVRAGDHAPIKVRFADRRNHKTTWTWKVFKAEFATLDAAKAFAEKFYADHPDAFVNDPNGTEH